MSIVYEAWQHKNIKSILSNKYLKGLSNTYANLYFRQSMFILVSRSFN